MAAILTNHHFGQLARIGEVAVVRKAQTIGGIDVEGLRVVRTVAAGSRVTYMADPDVALQLEHVLLLKDVAHQTRVLAHEQLAVFAGHDAGRILAAMLQYRQRVIDPLIDCIDTDHSDDTAHEEPPIYLILTPVKRSSFAHGSPFSPTMDRNQSPRVSP